MDFTNYFGTNYNNANQFYQFNQMNQFNNNQFNQPQDQNDDDDDFVEIDEEPNKEIKPGQTMKQTEMNIINSLLKEFDVDNKIINKQREEQKKREEEEKRKQELIEEHKKKEAANKQSKNLDDLFNLLDNIPQPENKNAIKNQTSQEPQSESKNKEVDDDDEFVSIEEDDGNQQNNNNLGPTKQEIAQQNIPFNSMTNNQAINMNGFNFFDYVPSNFSQPTSTSQATSNLVNENIQKKSENNAIPNENESVKNPNFTNDLASGIIFKEENKESNPQNTVNFNGLPNNSISIKTENIEPTQSKKTLSLDDLMGEFVIEAKQQQQEEKLKEIEEKEKKEKEEEEEKEKEKNQFVEPQAQSQTSKPKDDFEDDDFCEVEEEQNNITETNGEKNPEINPEIHVETKVEKIEVLQKGDFEMVGEDKVTVTKEETKEEFKEDLKIEDSEPKKEEEKVETKPSILNFTPMDFLAEFKKETKQEDEQSPPEEGDGGFEFVNEEEGNENNTKVSPEPQNTVEALLEKNFKTDELREKFYSNLYSVFKQLNQEMIKNIDLMKKISSFCGKKFNEKHFENNKQLINFLNGNIHLLINYSKFLSTKKYLNDSKCEINQKKFEELYKILLKISKDANFEPLVDSNLFREITKQNFTYNEKCKECHICLHSIDKETSTNVFGYDFHISCINIWLNLVNSVSPL